MYNNNKNNLEIQVCQKNFKHSWKESEVSLSFFFFYFAHLLYCFLKIPCGKIALHRMSNFLGIQESRKNLYSHTKVSIQEEIESFQSREKMRAHTWICAKGWKRKKVPLSPTLTAVSDKRTSRCTSANPRPQLFCF